MADIKGVPLCCRRPTVVAEGICTKVPAGSFALALSGGYFRPHEKNPFFVYFMLIK